VAADLTGKGWENCFGDDSKKHRGYLATLTLTTGGRLHWWQNVVTVNKYGGKSETGMPDFGIVLDGRLHFIECKHESSAPSMQIGWLTATKDAGGADKWTSAGVKPDQAEWMDAATKAGATCWVAARLEVNTRTREKSAQVRLGEASEPLPPLITRLIPWPEWRARMAAAEDCRRRGQEPQASIPAAELALMGWPLRSAHELLAALRSNREG
jgi:hypothetical protein